jgi:predicted transcriptional regulator
VTCNSDDVIAKIAGDIIIAYLSKRSVEPQALPALVAEVRRALTGPPAAPSDAEVAAQALRQRFERDEETSSSGSGSVELRTVSVDRPVPAVPVGESIRPDCIISLEDGKPYRTLRRHLMAKYGMTPDQYRAKWGLPQDYPMVAPDYAMARSEVAKRTGLGRRPPTSLASPAAKP